jgi:hypothetical protein
MKRVFIGTRSARPQIFFSNKLVNYGYGKKIRSEYSTWTLLEQTLYLISDLKIVQQAIKLPRASRKNSSARIGLISHLDQTI